MKIKNAKIYTEVDISESLNDLLGDLDIEEGYTCEAFSDLEIKLSKFVRDNGFWGDIPEEKEKEWEGLLDRQKEFIKREKEKLVEAIIKDLFNRQDD